MSETYKKILKDGSKVQVESAIRDGEGVKISTNYAKKSEIPKKQIIELVENGSTTAGTWLAKTDEITSLVDGQLFLYKIVVAGSSTTRLDISYKNSGGTYTSLGAKTVYSQATTAISTKFGVGCYVLFVYNTTNDCFRVVSNYDSDSNDIGVRDYYFRPYVAGEALYRYKLVALNKDNKLVPLTITNQTTATQVAKVPTQVEFRPENIWYYNSTSNVSANAVVSANVLYKSMYGSTASYMFNAQVPAYRLVYLRGTYSKTTGLFKLYKDSSNPCTSYYTFVPTNTNNLTLSSYFTNGYYYILVGGTYSTADYISYFGETQMFYFDGTNLIPYTLKLIPSKTSELANDRGFVTSSDLPKVFLVETDNLTQTTWNNKFSIAEGGVRLYFNSFNYYENISSFSDFQNILGYDINSRKANIGSELNDMTDMDSSGYIYDNIYFIVKDTYSNGYDVYVDDQFQPINDLPNGTIFRLSSGKTFVKNESFWGEYAELDGIGNVNASGGGTQLYNHHILMDGIGIDHIDLISTSPTQYTSSFNLLSRWYGEVLSCSFIKFGMTNSVIAINGALSIYSNNSYQEIPGTFYGDTITEL